MILTRAIRYAKMVHDQSKINYVKVCNNNMTGMLLEFYTQYLFLQLSQKYVAEFYASLTFRRRYVKVSARLVHQKIVRRQRNDTP